MDNNSHLTALIETCDIHASRLAMALRHISPLTPFRPEDFTALTDEQLGFMELLMSRFGKLQDTMGSKLFPSLMQLLQQDANPKSLLDTLHGLEKFGFLGMGRPSAREWIDMRELKNHLAHEYPDNPALMARNLNEAVQSAEILLKYWDFLKEKAQPMVDMRIRSLKTANRIRELRAAHGIGRGWFKNRVRLTPDEIDAICAAFRHFFAPEDHLWVFGSRVNLDARGGDIDLYVETTLSADEAVERERSFVAELCGKIGEQKIDVVLRLLSSDFHLPIYDVAREEGVQLV